MHSGGTKLLYTSIYDEENIWRGTLHVHSFWEAFFCLDGSCEFHVRRETFVTGAEDFILINPGVEHTEYNLGNKWVCIAFQSTSPFCRTVPPATFCFGGAKAHGQHRHFVRF